MTTVYTDSTEIASYLGATFTAVQAAQATEMAVAASDFVERALDRSWLGWTSGAAIAVADERHTVQGCRVWLRHAPVAAISAVSTRLRYAGATVYALDQAYQYELIEPVVGEVVFSPTYEGQRVELDYTSTEQTPAIIGQFATELAAGMLALSLAGSAASQAALTGVRRYTLWGGDLSVEYAAPSGSQANAAPGSTRLPSLWADIERLFSRRLVVA